MKKALSLILALILTLSVLPVSAAAKSSYTYTDPESGNSFTVDSDWIQEDLQGDPMYKVKFTHTDNDTAVIRYGSFDVWSTLSPQEQQSTPRGAYNHTMYTEQDIADLLGVKVRFVQTVSLSGRTYFRAEQAQSNFIFFKVTTTYLIHVDNGWMYIYCFSGSNYDALYYAFRKLVSGAVYPPTDPIPPAETTQPGETVPAGTQPGGTVPPTTQPVETTPPTTLPAETVPPTTQPVETTPPATQPVETTPPTTQPIETTPPTTQPVETTPPATQPAVPPEDDIYRRAKAAYEREDYQEAENLFSQIPNYLDSSDYLLLLRIRTYGSNTGIGTVYSFSKGLTDAQKKDIDRAAKNFDFADTARVLLWNVDIATYYLYDDWYTSGGLYLKWHKDSVGGYYYTRSNKLSTAISRTVSINDGYLRVDITTANTLVFHITLTGPDTMELYCYEYDKTYTLTR